MGLFYFGVWRSLLYRLGAIAAKTCKPDNSRGSLSPREIPHSLVLDFVYQTRIKHRQGISVYLFIYSFSIPPLRSLTQRMGSNSSFPFENRVGIVTLASPLDPVQVRRELDALSPEKKRIFGSSGASGPWIGSDDRQQRSLRYGKLIGKPQADGSMFAIISIKSHINHIISPISVSRRVLGTQRRVNDADSASASIEMACEMSKIGNDMGKNTSAYSNNAKHLLNGLGPDEDTSQIDKYAGKQDEVILKKINSSAPSNWSQIRNASQGTPELSLGIQSTEALLTEGLQLQSAAIDTGYEQYPTTYATRYLTGYCAARFKPIVLASIFDTGIIVPVNRIAEI
ncbi:hypothetical protein M747DRAFT_248840 [Aspergillus niger ATCC 13496]|uniref:Contig An05c0060, genomic contig n=3 Tax=Aspergillus niger TaxID=5061 RepID=A2QL11_ASPNC|nr:uncharacterized protein An05g02160 [Aspergillus niger]RDH14745.1 hypothetical protein M747DRAFT_248840 [Aspergillus niger ATCC 13496]CAK44877.1 unnamed protein product [Aspergillus niger]